MKAIGMVRRIEARVIITQKSINVAQTLGFSLLFCSKIFRENRLFQPIYSKSGVNFTPLLNIIILRFLKLLVQRNYLQAN